MLSALHSISRYPRQQHPSYIIVRKNTSCNHTHIHATQNDAISTVSDQHSPSLLEPVRLHARINHMTRSRIAHAEHDAQLAVALAHHRPSAELQVAGSRPARRPTHLRVHNAHHGALQRNAGDDLHDHQEHRLRALLVRILAAEADRHLRLDAEQQEAGKRGGALHAGDGAIAQSRARRRIEVQVAVRVRNQIPQHGEQQPAAEEAGGEQRDDEAPLRVDLYACMYVS